MTGMAAMEVHINLSSKGRSSELTDYVAYNASPLPVLTNMSTGSFLSFVKPFDVPHVRALYITFFSIIFCCCVLGNATVIYVILRHRKMRNVTNFFLANLAASDLCVGLFCVLPNLSTFLSPNWYLGQVMCKLYYFIQCASYTASILILTVISLERYFAIIHPMLNKRVTRMYILRWIVVAVWICAASYGVPNLLAYDMYTVPSGESDNSTLDFCVIIGEWQMDMEVYSVINFILLYVVPLLCITFMYVRISMVLWRSSLPMAGQATSRSLLKKKKTKKHNGICNYCLMHDECKRINCEISQEQKPTNQYYTLKTHDSDSTDKDGASEVQDKQTVILKCTCGNKHTKFGQSGGSGMTKTKVKRAHQFSNISHKSSQNPLLARRKVIRLLIILVSSFAICVLPHHIRLLWQIYGSQDSFSYIHMLIPPTTFLFFYANSALNPFLYALLSDHFRQAFRDLIPRCVYGTRRAPHKEMVMITHQDRNCTHSSGRLGNTHFEGSAV